MNVFDVKKNMEKEDMVYCFDNYVYERDLEKRHFNPVVESFKVKIQNNDAIGNNRSILVNWMMDVSKTFNMSEKCYYISVSYLDRILGKTDVPNSALQLVGCACLFIASKFEDIEQISSYDLAFVGDNSFTRDELIEMEQLILNALNFEMVTTNAHNFLFFFLRGFNLHEDKEIRETCETLLDLSIIPIEFRGYLPSLIALSILNMVAYTVFIKRNDSSIVFWNNEIENRFGYKQKN